MKAKEYLSKAYKLDYRIDCKLRQSEELRDLATRATASIHAERVSGTKQRSPMENAIVKLVDLEHEINADIDRLVDLKREIIDLIAKVENMDYQVLLENRYLNFMTWEAIAESMGFTVRNIYFMHGKALKEVDKILSLHCFSCSQSGII
jgi:hypothetical protein